ncbi:MAG: DUF1343 domain-containing protein [Desulfosalsimonadaceae bacterium]
MIQLRSGLEEFLDRPPDWLRGERLGLLCNPASTGKSFRHALELINKRAPARLTAVFSPQHGLRAEKQDNMIESDDSVDPLSGVPVFSLYGKTRKPSRDMFGRIDTLIIDLQDVGTRVYTFATTVSYCLEKAKETGRTVLLLDRPNPLNGIQTEGNLLDTKFASFVGRYPIPMRHGLTLGELALYINSVHSINSRLSVIPVKGWRRQMFFPDTGLHWVPPSPNLPTSSSALVYPGQVLFEGTNISEGRGTTTPFEIFGAPFIDQNRILSFMGGRRFPGGVLRPAAFEPMFGKWRHQKCRGFQLHITKPLAYNSYKTSLKLLQAIMHHHPREFQWRSPPYEYEWDTLPIDLIAGTDTIRQQLEAMEPVEEMAKQWQESIENFRKEAARFHLYD